jgi:hypothetical protein
LKPFKANDCSISKEFENNSIKMKHFDARHRNLARMSRNVLLREKLEAFIRKYYANELLRGAIFALGGTIAIFLSVALLEYLGRFGTTARMVLFFSSLTVFSALFLRFVAKPVLGLLKIGKRLSYTQAAKIIGQHFPEVKDKLLNTLQLEQMHKNAQENLLLQAAIDQKTESLKPVPFSRAIDFRVNKRYLRYALIPILLLSAVWIGKPEAITGSTKRLVQFNQTFAPEAGFVLNIDNSSLKAIENEDFILKISANGKIIPESVYLIMGKERIRMEKTGKNEFTYTFRHLRESRSFQLEADIYTSGFYDLEVLPRPSLLNLEITLRYPSYLGLAEEKIQNRGDLNIPEGTTVKWNIKTRQTEKVGFRIGDSIYTANKEGELFALSHRFMAATAYSISPENSSVGILDSQQFSVQVIPDRAPTIQVREVRDSILPSQIYLSGRAEDDYGINRIVFRYAISEKPEEAPDLKQFKSIAVQGIGTRVVQQFSHILDGKTLGLSAGQNAWYFFEAWDNDGIRGSKVARSQMLRLRMPDRAELEAMRKSDQSSVQSGLQETLKEALQIQEDLAQLRREMLQSREVNWQQKEKLQQLLERQKELERQLEQNRRRNEEKNLRDKHLSELERDILDKQKKLEELLEQIKNESLEKLFEEMQKNFDRMDKQQLQQMLEKMEMSNEDVAKELDRSLELFKQLAFEQNLRETLDKLEELAKKQESLQTDTEKSSEEKAEEQKKLEEEFKALQDDLRELEKENQELGKPREMPDTKELEENIEKSMQQAEEQLKSGQEQKAKKSQQNARQKMQEMQQMMESAMMQQAQEQQELDVEALRMLLNNLVQLSFSQEDLMKVMRTYAKNDPRIREAARNQRKLLDDSRVIEDSLMSLARRVPEIEGFVLQEMRTLRRDLEKGVELVSDRQMPQAMQRQQGAMTSANNLALMLSEVLEQMQENLGMGMAGSSSCSKPGKGVSPGSMQQLMQRQAGLEKKMQELMEKMRQQQAEKMGPKPGQRPGEKPGEGQSGDKPGQKPGEKPGGSTPGSTPGGEGGEGEQGEGGDGSGGNSGDVSRRLAQLAAEQEQIRRELEQMMQSLTEPGRKAAGDAIKKMEENETDILNRRLSEQTLKRQRDINMRLLESEKALREQDEDEKREARENKRLYEVQREKMEEYFREKEKEQEWLRTVSPALRPYFKEKVSHYFQTYK